MKPDHVSQKTILNLVLSSVCFAFLKVFSVSAKIRFVRSSPQSYEDWIPVDHTSEGKDDRAKSGCDSHSPETESKRIFPQLSQFCGLFSKQQAKPYRTSKLLFLLHALRSQAGIHVALARGLLA